MKGVAMNVVILATKGCSHCLNISRELDDLSVSQPSLVCRGWTSAMRRTQDQALAKPYSRRRCGFS